MELNEFRYLLEVSFNLFTLFVEQSKDNVDDKLTINNQRKLIMNGMLQLI